MIPPGDVFACDFGVNEVVEGEGDVERVEGGSEFFWERSLPYVFGGDAFAGMVNAAEIVGPSFVPCAFVVGGTVVA